MTRFLAVAGLVCSLLFAQAAGFAHAITHYDEASHHHDGAAPEPQCDWCHAFTVVGSGLTGDRPPFVIASTGEALPVRLGVRFGAAPTIHFLSRGPPA